MQDHFGKVVGRAKEVRHATDQVLREWGQRADENPVEVAATFVRSTLYWRKVWRRRYQRLAARAKRRVVDESEDAWLIALKLGEPRENASLVYALWQYGLWDSTYQIMLDVISIAEVEGEDPCQAIIGAFMFAQRRSYEVLANITRPEWTPPGMRSAIAAVLTGEVATQVSLLHNKRLANVLIEDGDAPKKRLLQVLPAAIMQEWDNPPDEYAPLLRRVTHLLEGGGSEQEHLGQLGKLATRPPTIVGGEDEDLAEFERQETLRQT
jgi:hypothetical protein